MAATELVASPSTWINRRVETVELLSHEETRRRVSIDYTLTPETQIELTLVDGVVVPIAILTKEPRRHFDLRDEGGRALPVLGKDQNGELSHIAVLNAALNAFPKLPSKDALELLSADLRRIVVDPPEDAFDALAYLVGSAEAGDPLRDAIWQNDTCRRLLTALSGNYVVFAVVPPGGPNRRVLKYAYGDDFTLTTEGGELDRLRPSEVAWRLWRPDRERFLVLTPSAGRAASFHVEVAIPEELHITAAFLCDLDQEELLSSVDENVNRASLYAVRQIESDSDVAAYVEVAPERGGTTLQAAATSAMVSGLLWLGVSSGLDAKNPGAAVSLLLAGAAFFSGLTAVRGGHRIVKRVFSGARLWLGVVTVSALVASATLAMEVPSSHPTSVWRWAAVATSVAFVRLLWSVVRAPT
jgi:hypothetical protein